MKKFLMILLMLPTIWGCKTKEVAPLPKAEFTYTLNSEGFVNFRSVSTNAASSEWSIDNTKRFTPNFDYNFTRNGNYQVSLTAKDAAGNNDVIVKTVSVNNITTSLTIYRKYPVGNSTIEVTIDGRYTGIISGQYYFASAPNCGNPYCASFTKLSEGTHSYYCKETATGAYWSGSVNLTPGDCQFISLSK